MAADGAEVYSATQDAAMANITAALNNPNGGPNFRPGTAQLAGTTFDGPGEPMCLVITPDAQAAIDQIDTLTNREQSAINAGRNGVVTQYEED